MFTIFPANKSTKDARKVLTIFIWHMPEHIIMPITFNNPMKAFISNKKYNVSIQTRTTKIEEKKNLALIRF